MSDAASSLRILYLYPEEWTGRRAREVHTLHTCAAMAEAGAEVCLVHAGGLDLAAQLRALGIGATAGNAGTRERLKAAEISRRFGPLKSAWFFHRRLAPWLARTQGGKQPFDAAFIIHLKAAAMLDAARLPYIYEAHEIFAETPPAGSVQERELDTLERGVLHGAHGLIATSHALAEALKARYGRSNADFRIVPHGGGAPVSDPEAAVAVPGAPFVYAGSLGDWKGLDIAMEALLGIADSAARGSGGSSVSLRVIGGSQGEWERLRDAVLARFPEAVRSEAAARLSWHPRVAPAEIPRHLAGARAGLIPTLPETGTGRYSCPMKLYDYARLGIPVVATALPSLDSLGLDEKRMDPMDAENEVDAAVQPWCTRVESPTVQAWRSALLRAPDPASPEATAMKKRILAWSAQNTWEVRGRRLLAAVRQSLGR